MTTATATGRAAAEQLAALLPTAVSLTVSELNPGQAPDAAATAVRAHFVGSTSADLMVIADEAIAAALASAGEDVSAADALRPALEAAAATLGSGVLDTAEVVSLGDFLTDPDVEAFALVGEDGSPQAWFAIRVRVSAPQQAAADHVPMNAAAERSRMRLLHDVELVLTAEIGHTRLPMRQVLDLVPGTVLELDRAAGSPADVMVNGRLVARGEVVVVDEDYGIRITEIVSTESGQ
ncbi:flagellar motor switch protein FliN [Demequina sp. TTPB684]|uniref:flagellar motor switch protein FliN n=1 Tax=unclassified Demequina TaxID=2620311 RepID=UPI001CF2623F|nr:MULTISPECIES: flagellar motor switch protein FliN [unclassified Demequina]MCB2412891.1 flagellar motor switch protein FliN [Demequina sp. TTPB684]UPU87883.1 flagellar motor switch protein FliN [Demequina sp. TMPB413]